MGAGMYHRVEGVKKACSCKNLVGNPEGKDNLGGGGLRCG
jgi:hypothetical protein